jgi:putative transposase
MSKPRKLEVNQYYHIYSRGVNKCLTFLEHTDYKRFESHIKKSNTKLNIKIRYTNNDLTQELVNVISYCLMPNHFHLILQEKTEGGISLFLQKVLSGYVSYFNKKYNRTGALFGSRFKDKLIHDETYFKHLLTYIWNNPIKILNPNYDSKDLLNGKIELSEEELNFAKNYPYKFSIITGRSGTAPTEEDLKILF